MHNSVKRPSIQELVYMPLANKFKHRNARVPSLNSIENARSKPVAIDGDGEHRDKTRFT